MTMVEVFNSLLDVPIDEYDPANDGDDSLVLSQGPYSASAQGPHSIRGPVRMVVPYFDSQRGAKGKHVRALNRALATAGFRRWQVFSLTFTRWTEQALKRFQRRQGLTPTGIYDRETHRRLAPFYDAYALKYLLIAWKPKPTKDELERAAFLAQLMYLYNNRWAVAYSQARPWDSRRPPRALDCSASGDWAAKHAKFSRTLSGTSWWGVGNTWTQLSWFRLRGHVREGIVSARPGDPLYYGSSQWNPTHVAFYIGHKDGRAIVFSFGSYPAKILDAAYRHDRIAVCNLTGR